MVFQPAQQLSNAVRPFASLVRRGWTALRAKGLRHFLLVSVPIGLRILRSELWSLLPDAFLRHALPVYWRLSPSDSRRDVRRAGSAYVVRNEDGTETHVPSLKSPVCFAENDDRIGDKYECEGFVEVASGDAVVDVGAFVGEFADYAARQGAERVVAIDPDERSFRCLVENTASYDQVEHLQAAVWSSGDETRQFRLSADPTESNLFSPDQSRTVGEITVPTVTVDDVAQEFDLEAIDFLKVESEGLELEILRGIEDVPVRKLAIDAGEPDPDGEIPRDDVVDLLTNRGYEVRVVDRIVFARKPE